MYDVVARGFYDEIVAWLEENVGTKLWFRPIVEAHGKHWHLNALGTEPGTFLVRLADVKIATICALKWS